MEGLAAAGSREPGVRKKVLVVDDEDDIRGALQEILDGEGYATVGASNGVEALEWLRAHKAAPSLILLDLMMPEMDGWDLLACIDDDRRLHRIPVALMSAHPSVRRAFDKHRNEEQPSRLLLPKPLNLLRLLATVRYFCSDGACGPPDGLDGTDDETSSLREAPTAKFRPVCD
jgi:CheY-like chemotaxis protein